MDIALATDLLWEAIQKGEPAPAALAKQLDVNEGQAVQLAILDRQLAAGKPQIGWKMAGTAPAAREMLKIETPAFGYLLENTRFESGSEIALPEGTLLFECELLLSVGKRLAGPGVDRAAAVAAIDRIEASFEFPQMRVSLADDLGLGVADDVAAWGLVVGDASPSLASDLDPGEIRVTAKKNGEPLFDVLSRDTVDDQYESVAKLANALGALGRAIEPGHCVLTGSFGLPVVVQPGDHWEAELSSVGSVAVRFR